MTFTLICLLTWLSSLNYLNKFKRSISEQLLPFPLCFFCFCSLNLSSGKSLRSKLYKFLAKTLVRVSIVSDHSVANSSQQVNDDNTDNKSSQSSREMYTFKFALIQATIRVYKNKYSEIMKCIQYDSKIRHSDLKNLPRYKNLKLYVPDPFLRYL